MVHLYRVGLAYFHVMVSRVVTPDNSKIPNRTFPTGKYALNAVDVTDNSVTSHGMSIMTDY